MSDENWFDKEREILNKTDLDKPDYKITMTKCELCGSDVKVVGTTTLHYEPSSPSGIIDHNSRESGDKIPEREQDKPAPRTFWLAKPDLDFDLNWKQIHAAEHPHVNTLVDSLKVIEASYAKALELQVEELTAQLRSESGFYKPYAMYKEENSTLKSRVRELEIENKMLKESNSALVKSMSIKTEYCDD